MYRNILQEQMAIAIANGIPKKARYREGGQNDDNESNDDNECWHFLGHLRRTDVGVYGKVLVLPEQVSEGVGEAECPDWGRTNEGQLLRKKAVKQNTLTGAEDNTLAEMACKLKQQEL